MIKLPHLLFSIGLVAICGWAAKDLFLEPAPKKEVPASSAPAPKPAPKKPDALPDLPANAPQLVHELRKSRGADDNDVILVGDATFIAKMLPVIEAGKKRNQEVFVVTLPQFDLYAFVQLYPALSDTLAKNIVIESIPAFWTGQPYLNAFQPPIAWAKVAAGDQSVTLDPAAVQPATSVNRDYVPTDAETFDKAALQTKVFDNYYSYFEDIEGKLLWVTNDELFAQASPAFQTAYAEQLTNAQAPINRIGVVGSVDSVIEKIRAK